MVVRCYLKIDARKGFKLTTAVSPPCMQKKEASSPGSLQTIYFGQTLKKKSLSSAYISDM